MRSPFPRIEIDIEERLRTEAMHQRHPPPDWVIGQDGGRVLVRPAPDYAMAELLEEAANTIATLRRPTSRPSDL